MNLSAHAGAESVGYLYRGSSRNSYSALVGPCCFGITAVAQAALAIEESAHRRRRTTITTPTIAHLLQGRPQSSPLERKATHLFPLRPLPADAA